MESVEKPSNDRNINILKREMFGNLKGNVNFFILKSSRDGPKLEPFFQIIIPPKCSAFTSNGNGWRNSTEFVVCKTNP